MRSSDPISNDQRVGVEECRIVPDLGSHDQRRGFELFEGVLEQLLMVGAIVFIAGNLLRAEAAFLASSEPKNFWAFVYDVVAQAIRDPDNAARLAGLIGDPRIDLPGVTLALLASVFFLIGYMALQVQSSRLQSPLRETHGIFIEAVRPRPLRVIPLKRNARRWRT